MSLRGLRGGVDQVCRIEVVLRSVPSLVFESRDPSLNAPSTVLCPERSDSATHIGARRMRPLRRSA